jgi:hypothetical protein
MTNVTRSGYTEYRTGRDSVNVRRRAAKCAPRRSGRVQPEDRNRTAEGAKMPRGKACLCVSARRQGKWRRGDKVAKCHVIPLVPTVRSAPGARGSGGIPLDAASCRPHAVSRPRCFGRRRSTFIVGRSHSSRSVLRDGRIRPSRDVRSSTNSTILSCRAGPEMVTLTAH